MMGRATAHQIEGGAIVLEVVQVTTRSRIAHVGKNADVLLNAKVAQRCLDCRVKHKVAVEESK